MTEKVWPAMVSDPVRTWAVVLAWTWKTTVPLPVPDAPLVTVMNVALLAAVHEQPFDAWTDTFPVPPAGSNDWLVGDSENVHAGELELPELVLATETQITPLDAPPSRTHGATSTYAVTLWISVVAAPADRMPVAVSCAVNVA